VIEGTKTMLPTKPEHSLTGAFTDRSIH